MIAVNVPDGHAVAIVVEIVLGVLATVEILTQTSCPALWNCMQMLPSVAGLSSLPVAAAVAACVVLVVSTCVQTPDGHEMRAEDEH